MTKSEIISLLDSQSTYKLKDHEETPLLIGFNKKVAFSIHRVNWGDGWTEPIVTLLAPKFKPDASFEEVEDYENMKYMTSNNLLKEYSGIKEAMKKF